VTSDGTLSIVSGDNPTPIDDRHIQLTAQVLQALEAVEHFAQILLLSERVA
jgi:hypothetical protein